MVSFPDRLIFFESIKNTYLAAAIVNTIAIALSILQIRGKRNREKTEVSPKTAIEPTLE